MRVVGATVVAFVLLAGCFGGSEDLEAPALTDDDGGSAMEDPGLGPIDPQVRETSTLVEVPVAHEGSLRTSIMHCQTSGSGTSCGGTALTSGTLGPEFKLAGPVDSFQLMLEWDAVTPLMGELILLVMLDLGNDRYGIHRVTGNSPLALDIADAEQGNLTAVVVRAPSHDLEEHAVIITHDQEYRLAGTFMVYQ